MSRRTAAAVGGALALVLAVPGCGASAADQTVLVRVTGAGFDDATIVVPPGTEVRWRNFTGRVHALVPQDRPDGGPGTAQDWGADRLWPGDTYSHTFEVPGEYAYRCTLHPDEELAGVVRVEGG